jgi:hypothetical protein
VKDGTVAALGSRLVHLDHFGKVKNLADADSAPFDIRAAADGKVAFVDRKNDAAVNAKLFTGSGKSTAIASGRRCDLNLIQGEAGKIFLTGTPWAPLPPREPASPASTPRPTPMSPSTAASRSTRSSPPVCAPAC